MRHLTRYILLPALMLSGIILTSCKEEGAEITPTTSVDINIYVPESKVATRADVGTIPGTDEENALHLTYIWIYENAGGDDGAAVAFKPVDLSDVTPDNTGKYTVQVQLPVTTILEKKNIDVFVLANVESIPTATVGDELLSDITDKKSIKRSDLLAIQFGKIVDSSDNVTGDDFGVTDPTYTVPYAGLPFSEYALNQDIYTVNGTSVSINSTGVSLALRRAVSKIRFVIGRLTGYTGVSVTGITFDESLIPTAEYAFPAHTAIEGSTVERTPNLPAGVTYENAFSYSGSLSTEAIFEDNNPNSYVFGANGNETGQAYINRLDAALTNKLSDEDALAAAQTYGLTYFRESDKKLTGKVLYQLPGDTQDREAEFVMEEPCDFTRNHYYVVYGYFDRGQLVLTVTVQPWELQESTIEYSQTPSYQSLIAWTENTYDQTMSYPVVAASDDGIRTITLRTGTTAECTFEITSPQGFSWIASFTSLSGNPQAFKFVHADNSESDTFTGTVGTGVSTLKIKAVSDSPSETSAAILTLTVRQGEGKNIPLSELSIYKIVQVAN